MSLVLISMQPEELGKIIHTNQELQRVLGHMRKDLIGKKINVIQPSPIAAFHDQILRRFLETAKRNVLNHSLQLFAIDGKGYLRPINIIVNLYPQISDKIIIVGFLQTLAKLEGMELQQS